MERLGQAHIHRYADHELRSPRWPTSDGRIWFINQQRTPLGLGRCGARTAKWSAITKHPFKVGDHVRWNSEAGRVTGHITKVHTRDTDYKGYTRHCTPDDPQYEIKSDKTDHVAMHKGSALRKIA